MLLYVMRLKRILNNFYNNKYLQNVLKHRVHSGQSFLFSCNLLSSIISPLILKLYDVIVFYKSVHCIIAFYRLLETWYSRYSEKSK